VRRVAIILVALFLVNLPFVHETLDNRKIDRSGREVEATVLKTGTINGRHLVDYRLPRSIDRSGATFSGRVDAATYEQARETKVIAVRVVPDEPAANRPVGEVRSPLFTVVALVADAVILVVGLLFLRRWRRWSLYEVLSAGDGLVTLRSRQQTLTAAAPEGWAGRVQPGDRVSGKMHLVAEGDVLPGIPQSGLEQIHGASYVVRGRVLDARSNRVQLELSDGFRISVETRGHRIRADIRDSTEVHGTLCFTPTVSRD
jgi:hypothetical protein